MSEMQDKVTVMEVYTLPSKGEIYNVKMDPVVELRSMTARDEMKRTSPSANQFRVLAGIIEGCLINKLPISVYDLALADYEYLLHKLRVVTYGDTYKMQVVCPHCGEVVEATTSLDELAVKEFDKQKFEDLRNFTLPRSNHVISIRFQTPRMLDMATARAKELRKKFKDADIDFDSLVLLEQVIESVDGAVLSGDRLESFINKLPALDMTKILNNLEALNNCIGLQKGITVTCTHCRNDIDTFFRLGPEFFRPTTI